jgi:6-phosphofructokinase 1
MTATKKGNFGIVVSGGPAPGINGVINACVIAAANQGYKVWGLVDGFRGVCTDAPNAVMPLQVDAIARIYGTGGSILGIARFNPLSDAIYEKRLLSTLEQHQIDKLVVIGGDGSALLSYALSKKHPHLNIVHVPKTIDNDLILPDEHPSFGFETARYAGTEILETLKTDARTSKRWFVVESMGRRAGFLALGLGIASGSPLTIIPEEYEGRTTTTRELAEVVLNTMLKRHAMNKPYGVVILAEGLIDCIDPNSSPVLQNAPRDELGRLIHSEIEFGEIIRAELRTLLAKSGLKTTINTKNLGYELRCHKPISFDIEYSRFLGVGAVEHLLGGLRGIMVTREYDKLGHISLESMLDQSGKIRSRKVNLKSDLYRVARTFMIR